MSVNISPEPSTTKLTILNYDTATGLFSPPSASVPYGSLLLLRADVTGQSGYGKATGSTTLTDGTSSLGQFALNGQGYTEDMPSNLLLGGGHKVNVSYGGNASFKASNGSGSITITPAPMTCKVSANTTTLRPGWVLVLTPVADLYQAKIAPTLGNMVAPTGTMSIYSATTLISGPTTITDYPSAPNNGIYFGIPLATIPQITFQLSQIPSISDPITITYSGDSNYANCTSPPLNLTYSTAPVLSQTNMTLSAYQNILVGTPITLTASIIAATLPPAYEPSYPTPTGTVQLAVDGTNVGSAVSVTAGPNDGGGLTGIANLTISTTGLSAGIHAISLNYSGDANYQPSTANVNI